jgi:uncharacterized membrane protein YheB (UPF0754 family)
MIAAWILPVVFGAFIGWGTNWLALKMLFHPRKLWGIRPLRFQGVIPRRKLDIAARLGEMVENELVSHDDIRAALENPVLLDGFRKAVSEQARIFAEERLPSLHPMVGMFLTQGMKDKVAGLLSRELDALVPSLGSAVADGLESSLSFKDLVRHRVEGFSVERVESLLLGVLKKEFGFIEWSGAVLGALVGLGQAGLNAFLR